MWPCAYFRGTSAALRHYPTSPGQLWRGPGVPGPQPPPICIQNSNAAFGVSERNAEAVSWYVSPFRAMQNAEAAAAHRQRHANPIGCAKTAAAAADMPWPRLARETRHAWRTPTRARVPSAWCRSRRIARTPAPASRNPGSLAEASRPPVPGGRSRVTECCRTRII